MQKNKVITRLCGGIGNQMFQYAAGRSLSLKLDCPLFLDASWYENRSDRKLLVNKFCLADKVSLMTDKKLYFLNKLSGKLSSKIISIKENVELLRENKLSYNPEYDEVKGSVLLDGYWQSEKYFFKYRDYIIQDFNLIENPPEKYEEMKNEIKASEAVCIHIRRGDYISNKFASKMHGLCPMSYYMNSIDYFSKKFMSPKFFIFSDDPAWVFENMSSFSNIRIVDVNEPDDAYLDLILMSNCKHFIIANSTFSWWAAWLSIYANKTIISPKNWFKDSSINNNDLIPEGWLKY